MSPWVAPHRSVVPKDEDATDEATDRPTDAATDEGSDDFGVTHPTQVVPAPARAALALAGPPRNPGPIEPPSMLAVDAPDHPRYRKLVSRAFTARRVAALRERTTEVAQELLDDMDRAARDGDGHSVDLVAHYASLLPVTVISEMLGVPTSMREQFLSWGDGAATSTWPAAVSESVQSS